MKKRKVIWIALAVGAVHVVAFLYIGGMRVLPPSHSIPPPNFAHREVESEDPATGAKVVYREYQVSTKLHPRKPLDGAAKSTRNTADASPSL